LSSVSRVVAGLMRNYLVCLVLYKMVNQATNNVLRNKRVPVMKEVLLRLYCCAKIMWHGSYKSQWNY
jgi:hypothetical protein